MDWQECYRKGDTPWDKGEPAPALVDFLRDHSMRGRVFVPGCGTGSDLVPVARAGADEVTGLDIAPAAVEAARRRIRDLPNARVLEGDLFAVPQGPLAGTMDWVFEHTCFCAIPPHRRPDWVEAVASVLKPGGHLLAIFFLNPWDPGEDPTQGPPFGTTVEELQGLLSPRFTLLEAWQPVRTFPGREGREQVQLLRANGPP